MKKVILPLIYFFLSSYSLFGQFINLKETYTIARNPMLDKLISVNDYNGNINLLGNTKLLNLENTILGSNQQELVKNGEDLYILVSQTGMFFQLDSVMVDSLRFIRADRTINLNYNIGAINFFYKDQFYSYGGYGFWKVNGYLRKFNVVDKEWDINPLNKEIIAGGFEWFSAKEGRLYVPFQKIINAGLNTPDAKTGIIIPDAYYLDINKNQWIQTGKISSDFLKLVRKEDKNIQVVFDKGLIFMISDQAYFFDLIHNKIYKSTNSNLDQFLLRRQFGANLFCYKDVFYSYNIDSKKFSTWKFDLKDFVVLDFSIWTIDYTMYYIVFGIIIAIVIAIIFYILLKRKITSRLQNAQLKMLKTDSIQQAFAGVELNLIELLIEENKKGKKVEIHQMNHVLGIKDKNIGLQKKVRSDVINSINDKYQFITQTDHLLISSVRKIDDKRFFEYFIADSEINNIQRIIKSN
ncbi:MAG: hypothetical protein RLZZ328_591 [Bacteroidota bacterium]